MKKLILKKVPILKIKMGTFLKINSWADAKELAVCRVKIIGQPIGRLFCVRSSPVILVAILACCLKGHIPGESRNGSRSFVAKFTDTPEPHGMSCTFGHKRSLAWVWDPLWAS
jgi:hypothetical protein